MNPAGTLRPLNGPRPVHIAVNDRGVPERVRARSRWKRVGAILEMWRIDDEWWRDTISRAYFSLLLEGGEHLTVYRDLVEDRWYVQAG